ncbi:peptidyl-prolyl cis-trans isomerase PASTICCINO1-like [Carya illinoinensis]|uniref:Uncharacterized protein n=1 Tax=Carya illinoinensis TaxID=32201 RepID=A0A922DY58_CARIL|nr:peptidyl-prolyl cis-trans isomerase PASTICCINO1-like [Carya illinoinensis]KAG6693094.1 hypothetical protein I3842_10G147800 [Carya illinoinensis]
MALYRRGMAYTVAGDFEEAKANFKMMMKSDKSSEAEATAALLKLQQKEQEVERKARKQFKGLFDKKPREIAEVGDREEDHDTGEKQKNIDKGDSEVENSDESHEDAADARQMGWFSHFWPTSRRLFSGLGLQRCTIL